MESGEYAELARREEFYFWNIGRRELIQDVLERFLPAATRRTVLDVGCGPGGNMLALGRFGDVTGLDIAPEAIALAKAYGYRELVLGDAARLPFPDVSFDLVAALDALEHVPSDTAALAEAHRVLAPGGSLLLTVPAHPWLFGPHDRFLRHFRRYAAASLRKKLAAAGFRVLFQTHFVTLGVPINVLRLTLDALRGKAGATASYDPRRMPAWMNAFFLRVLRLERGIARFVSLPFGTSLVVVARKD